MSLDCVPKEDRFVNLAFESGNLKLVDWTMDEDKKFYEQISNDEILNDPDHWKPIDCLESIMKGGSMEILEWFLEELQLEKSYLRCQIVNFAIDNCLHDIMLSGSVKILQWFVQTLGLDDSRITTALHDTSDIVFKIALKGHYDMLAIIWDHSGEAQISDFRIIKNLTQVFSKCKYQHLDCLYKIIPSKLDEYARQNYINIIEYSAIDLERSKKTLLWLHQHYGLDFKRHHGSSVLKTGNLDFVKFIHSLGITWKKDDIQASNFNADTKQWLLNNVT
jgi:hypothetical protein